MGKSKVFQTAQKRPRQQKLILTTEEKKRLVDFFSLLIEIDQQNKPKGDESKNVWNSNHTH